MLALEGEQIAELKNKLRKKAVQNARVKADMHKYQLELQCLEELLQVENIPHPKFSDISERFRGDDETMEIDPTLFSTEEKIILSRWLDQAIRMNDVQMDKVRQE